MSVFTRSFSIRNFLLIYILCITALVASLSALGDYFLNQSDVQKHMDGVLEQMGLSFHAVLASNSTEPKTSRSLQNKYFNRTKYDFQVWSNNNALMLYSPSTTNIDFNIAPVGLSDLTINNEIWRIFKVTDSETQWNYIVAEKYNARNRLLWRIGRNNFYILLLALPFSGILIWLIVGYGFRSVTRISSEVSNRAHTYLKPVELESVPLEIKPLIIELNDLFIRLHEAFEREKRFAGDAAHELRTPLAALKTQAQIVLKTSDEKERHTLLENLILAVDRITHIVQQLLILSRLVPEAASIYDIVEVDLPKIAAEVIAQLVPMALEKDIEIALDSPDSVKLRANLTGLSILIRNLVDNAIRYTPEHGQVTVEISDISSHVILKVIDSGPGIPEELRSRVFERFYRMIGNSAAGSGLGLAIVQQISELHQADIKLTTPTNGKGLQIEIWLPK
ncbi:MAG: ATP-binding protein, partial [Gammaproteobacteria bacterium]|nr:ATP-binding protein [Gammaproteobacteria bacterium]